MLVVLPARNPLHRPRVPTTCPESTARMQRIIERLETQQMTRIVAFGASATAKGYHCEGHYNWFDWLDVGLSQQFGRCFHTINAGVSGQSSRDLLARFERDCALYQPHVVLVMAGGNDCNPTHSISPEDFRTNMTEIIERTQALGTCVPVLQTYYSFDIEMVVEEAERAGKFGRYMQVVREVAEATGSPLIDHLSRWERLRLSDVATYRTLMRDAMHVNPLGNMVLGMDCLTYFGARVRDEIERVCEPGLKIQELLDQLEKASRAAACC